ncbi:hypothetical protein RRG08_003019 [Elysia crispata]|uniref:Uncharacterized protein n=1 Tax=Elysia crispata TaxID=231223 RepID=A0AAE0XU92_9GAST|nr:hypothetical protein RRG08_003019 [Elysia crispata]
MRRFKLLLPEEVHVASTRGGSSRFYPRRFMSLLPREGSCRFYHAEVQDASTTRRFMSLLPEEVQVASTRVGSCRI